MVLSNEITLIPPVMEGASERPLNGLKEVEDIYRGFL
jgi:hypothetical protein